MTYIHLENIPSSMDTHTLTGAHMHTLTQARCSKSVLIITSPSHFYHCSPFTSFVTSKQHFYLNQPNRAGCCHGIRAVFKTIRLYSSPCYSVCVHHHNRTGQKQKSPKSLVLFNGEKTKTRLVLASWVDCLIYSVNRNNNDSQLTFSTRISYIIITVS